MGERSFRSYQEAATFAKGLVKKRFAKTKLIALATEWRVTWEDAVSEAHGLPSKATPTLDEAVKSSAGVDWLERRPNLSPTELEMNNELRVGYFANRRLVVYDPKSQPSDPVLMLIYSVHGHTLCCRYRQDTEPKLKKCVSAETYDFALHEYQLWIKENPERLAAKLSGTSVDPDFPPLRRKCLQCEGMGTWMDRINKCSYGVIEEDSNIVERCSHCNGSGLEDDFLSNR